MLKVITFGAKLQGEARTKLVNSMQDICDKCESAYAKVLEKLLPVKNAFFDRKQLVSALREFAADPITREAFKPEKLCGSVDQLLDEMQSYLKPMRYSIEMRRVSAIKDSLHMIGNYDAAIRQQYDEFTQDLDGLATDLEKAENAEAAQLVEYLRNTIQDFQNELSATIKCVRGVKREILHGP